MKRRRQGHDYQGRRIYMVTLSVEGRRPLLGHLAYREGNDEPYIEPTPLGQAVEQQWQGIPHYYPEVKMLAFQLMPDHIHGLLFVTRHSRAHLGQIVNGFKVGCNRAYRQIVLRQVHYPEAEPQETPLPHETPLPQETPLPRPKHPDHGLLFETGYQDSILTLDGQLAHMFRYIADNPRRLAIKRANPNLFRVVRDLAVGGRSYAAIGNHWLLEWPTRLQVRCHNNNTPDNLRLIEKQKVWLMDRGRHGGVLVSPCIAPGEREIARAALDAGLPLIVILENGFPPMYKPPGMYFEACAKGLLLMLTPWPYHADRRAITRQQCLELNAMAQEISNVPWTIEQEEALKGRP